MGVLEAGLKVVQGKSVVNSISLKEGEENSYDKLRFADGMVPQSSSWRSMKPARQLQLNISFRLQLAPSTS